MKDYTPGKAPGLPYNVGEYLDLKYYDQKGEYENMIRHLQQPALNEILLLNTDQIERQLKRILQKALLKILGSFQTNK